MAGGVESAVSRGAAELDALMLIPQLNASAVDLGAGFGMHSIPLARRGFRVLALDSSAELLGELTESAGTLPIQTVVADLLSFRRHLTVQTDVVLCMGDTLTHLPDRAMVETLIAEAAAALTADGIFVITFRDYTTALLAERRFISVRCDADRILTCFLEYEDDHVVVHDLLNERDGLEWKLRVSSYRKLRLAPEWTCNVLAKHGFEVTREPGLGGMVRLVSRLNA
jgi:SAM-dependent methyltransferase